jgi:hypothetical protein
MILVSILAGLSERKKLLENSIESVSNDYQGKDYSFETGENLIKEENGKAPVTGKYIIASTEKECYTYLKKGTDITDVSKFTYTTSDCNANVSSAPEKYTIYEIYSFEE